MANFFFIWENSANSLRVVPVSTPPRSYWRWNMYTAWTLYTGTYDVGAGVCVGTDVGVRTGVCVSAVVGAD